MKVWDENDSPHKAEGADHPIFEVALAESETALQKATTLANAIVNQATWAKAAEFRKVLNIFKKKAIEDIEPIRKPAHEAYQAILSKRDEIVKPLEAAMKVLDRAIGLYWDDQERKRVADQAKAQAQLKRDQEDALLNAAEQIAASGDKSTADAILSQSVPVVPVQIPQMEKPEGVSFSKRYSIAPEINLLMLCQAIALGVVPVEAVMPNFVFLNAQARLLKESMDWPGVQVQMETNVSSRAK